MAALSDADQGGLPVPRLDSGGADRLRPCDVYGPGATRGVPRDTGMAEFLFQVADDGRGAVSGARPVYSVDEAEKYAAVDDGRGIDYPPRAGILRLGPTRSWQCNRGSPNYVCGPKWIE